LFTNRYPNFAKGKILKTEMLDSLRDFPKHGLDILYQEHSDGVLCGATVRVETEALVIGRGMVKWSGRIYMLEAEHRMPYRATGKETVLKVRFKEEDVQNDFIVYASEVLLDEDTQLHSNELELGRFKLKDGARLRTEYQSLADFATEYNTWNVLQIPYSGYSGSTLHPAVLKFFARELFKCGSSNPVDMAFAMQCMGQPVLDRELIVRYVTYRLGLESRSFSNTQLHKYLTRIIEEAKGDYRGKPDFRKSGPPKVVVD
jgi:hypothetical protein